MQAAMTPPASLDLRSNIDTVYDQSISGACMAHAVINALDAMHDHAGQSKRFSRAWVWWWARVHAGKMGQNVGVGFENLEWALRTRGAVLESSFPWGQNFVGQPPPNGLQSAIGNIKLIRAAITVDDIKHKLCMGVPVGIYFHLPTDFSSLWNQKDWRKSSFKRGGSVGYSHAMCVVGYDDAAGRLLVENSWGPGFADGGFFGLPYDDVGKLGAGGFVVDWIEGFRPKRAEDYMSIPFMLTASDWSTAFRAAKPIHKAKLDELVNTEDWQGVINYAAANGLTDRVLENIFLLNRESVRELYEQTKNELDWSKFVWAEL